jgi:hypothetical protein
MPTPTWGPRPCYTGGGRPQQAPAVVSHVQQDERAPPKRSWKLRRRRLKTMREKSRDGRSPGFTCDQGPDNQITNARKILSRPVKKGLLEVEVVFPWPHVITKSQPPLVSRPRC